MPPCRVNFQFLINIPALILTASPKILSCIYVMNPGLALNEGPSLGNSQASEGDGIELCPCSDIFILGSDTCLTRFRQVSHSRIIYLKTSAILGLLLQGWPHRLTTLNLKSYLGFQKQKNWPVPLIKAIISAAWGCSLGQEQASLGSNLSCSKNLLFQSTHRTRTSLR